MRRSVLGYEVHVRSLSTKSKLEVSDRGFMKQDSMLPIEVEIDVGERSWIQMFTSEVRDDTSR